MKSKLLWGALPYVTAVLFLVIPFVRMKFRPFAFSTRSSNLFHKRSLGVASLLMHWGLFIALLGHLSGLYGGLVGSGAAITTFYWVAMVGGLMILVGSIVALVRRIVIREVRAMSQPEDYIIHLLLIPIVTLALYQVFVHRIFGIAYTASAWVGSLWSLRPQPELMDSASLITKWHVLLAMTFFAYFPFTKLVHFWTYPVNYFVRPYQSMRTVRRRFQRSWEFALRNDKSWMTYGIGLTAVIFLVAGFMVGHVSQPQTMVESASVLGTPIPGAWVQGQLAGYPLYVSQCARCHGLNGKGDGPGAGSPTFAQPPRDFVKAIYHFISTTNQVATDSDLTRTISSGLQPAGMPAFSQLSDAQIGSLVQILREFQAKPSPEPTPVQMSAPPAQPDVTLGQQLFQANCAVCHGPSGHGDGPSAIGLPIRPRDLTRPGTYKAGSDPTSVYRRIAAGIPPYMPAQHGHLSSNEIWMIVAYERTLQGQSDSLAQAGNDDAQRH